MNFYKSWKYLDRHPMFKEHFQDCLCMEVVKINPKTRMIDSNKKNNTKINIWLECGPYMVDVKTHDIVLDCGAETFEKAICKLAKLVKKHYGDNSKEALRNIKEKY